MSAMTLRVHVRVFAWRLPSPSHIKQLFCDLHELLESNQLSKHNTIQVKVRNFEANERYRLCYRNKHLPCIFTFQHTHLKNWFLPWARLKPTSPWLLVGHATLHWPLHWSSRLPRWQRSRLTRWLRSVGIPRVQLFFTWECILASTSPDRA